MQRRGSANGGSTGGRIRVAVRVRPPDCKISQDETCSPCVAPSPHACEPNVVEFRHQSQSKKFRFDHVFGADAKQDGVYASAVQPLMAQFLDGYNVTVMAYGQTGSGKTYTMGNKVAVFNTTPSTSPCRERASSIPPPMIMTPEMRRYQGSDDDGLMPRFLHDLFANLKREPSAREIRVTFVEIHHDTLRDLLVERSYKTLTIREDAHSVWVDNLHSVQVDTLAKALEVLNAGRARQTVLNDASSRSHAVYTMEVSRKFHSEVKKSKVTFVDLAGSERTKTAQAEGSRQQVGSHNNLGLSSLGNVISALAEERRSQRRNSQDSTTLRPSSVDPQVPYSASKLTRLLRDGLGGNARALIIACVSSLGSNADETISTLHFANRALQNKAEKSVGGDLLAVHPNPNEKEIARLLDDVKRLQEQISLLEVAASRREEEILLAERAWKENKRDDCRDVEMTTEIAILPHVDAHTQHEGECIEEQQLSCVDAVTMTDCFEEAPLPPTIDHVDASVQIGASLSQSTHAEIMTDREPSTATSEAETLCGLLCPPSIDAGVQYGAEMCEAGTLCDLLCSPSIDCAVQFGASYLHFQDIEIATVPEHVLETCDGSTECLVETADATCQHDMPTSECVDVGVDTDSQSIVDMADAFSECIVGQVADAECQPDASWSSTADAAVGSEDDTASEASVAGQYDLASLAGAAASTDAVATSDMLTQCLGVESADVSCQSEGAVSTTVEVATSTDLEPTMEAVDASTDSLTIRVADGACQSELSSFQRVEFGVTTDPVRAIATATASTECISESAEVAAATESETAVETVDAAANTVVLCVADEACQSESTDVQGAEFGMTTDPAPTVMTSTASTECCGTDLAETACQCEVTSYVDMGVTTDGCDLNPVDVGIQSEHSSFQSKDADTTTDDYPTRGMSKRSYPDITEDEVRNSSHAQEFCTDEFPDIGITSSSSSPPTSSHTDLSAQSTAILPESIEHDTVKLESNAAVHGSDFATRSTPASCPDVSLMSRSPVTTSMHEDLQTTRTKSTSDMLFELLQLSNSAYIPRPVTPNANENEIADPTASLSANALEADSPCYGMYVCGPADDDDDEFLNNSSSTARGIPESASDNEQDSELANANPPLGILPPLPIPLSVKPSLIQMGLIVKEDVDEREHARKPSPIAPASPDFVVVRSLRHGNRSSSQRSTPVQVSPRGLVPKRSCLPSHQVVHPLRVFTFDDSTAVAPTPEKTAAQAKHLYENLRQLTRDEFGCDTDDDEHSAVVGPQGHSTVGQLMTGTKEFIQRRLMRQQRIAHVRGRVRTLEELLQVDNRAPISEPELNAYSGRVQEEFLHKLHQQLVTLAAERLHTRLKARLAAEPLPSNEDDATCPFLRLDQCNACAQWFFHHTEDAGFFETQILPFITSGWISLTPHELSAEQAWFQL